jgi:putative membrane protein
VHNVAFLAKMTLLVLVLALEVWPMTTLIRWRIALGRGREVDAGPAANIALISRVQAGLIVAMVFAATAMARGLGVL